MAKVPNAVVILPKNFNRLSRVHERYRQTDDRQTDGRAIAYSERERKFTFAKNVCNRCIKYVLRSIPELLNAMFSHNKTT